MEWKFKKGCKGQKENKEAIKSSQKRVCVTSENDHIQYSNEVRGEPNEVRQCVFTR